MRTLVRTWTLSCRTAFAILACIPSEAARRLHAREPGDEVGEGVRNEVEGRTTILHIKPAGSPVKKGEIACLLDPSAWQNKLANQSLILLGARAACENARLDREEAEAAITDYVATVYKQEVETIRGEIALAESDLKRAEDRLKWLRRMFERDRTSRAQLRSYEISLEQKIFALEQAKTKLKVLEQYTKDKTTRALQTRVEDARREESAKQFGAANERAVEARMKEQVEDCVVYSPADGRISYPRSIRPGAVVREGEILFRVIPEEDRPDLRGIP